MNYRYHLLDVFTDRPFGGNPLAVFPDGRGLSDEWMQRIAGELNLSETVFLLPPETAEGTRRLRIFTPGMEMAFAGHPTVGTALLLAELEHAEEAGELRLVLEENVGPVPVTVRREGGKPPFAVLTAAQPPEVRPAPLAEEELARLVGLDPADLAGSTPTALPAAAISTGMPFTLIPVRDLATLGRARLDPALWAERLAGAWAPHVYVAAPAGEASGADFRVRMFAPAMGISEDPATGAAAAAFAGYLALRPETPDGLSRWTVEQGVEMGRPSRLHLEAETEDSQVRAIRVGGTAVTVGEGVLRVP